MKKDFLTLLDKTTEELKALISLALKLKKERADGVIRSTLKGKSIGLIFEKSSTRTRVSFEVGITELGGYPLFLSSTDIQLGRGESVKDTARVLSRYLHGVMIRTYGHARIEEFAKFASIPVINGLTDEYHPCQILADIMTVYENFGKFEGVNVVYAGDGNNISNSWLNGAAKFGMNLTVASPKECTTDELIFQRASKEAEKTGAILKLTTDIEKAVIDADVIITDVWTSMGQEAKASQKAEALRDYKINKELMCLASKNAIFLHCLPAHLGDEVTEEVFESKASKVFDEAENRLHVQKAVMLDLFGS